MPTPIESNDKVLEGFFDWIAEQRQAIELEMKQQERVALVNAPFIESAEKRGLKSDLEEEFNNAAFAYFKLRTKFRFFDECFMMAFGKEQTFFPDTPTGHLLWEWYRVEELGEVKGGEA